ncbi:hypothetical protein JCM3766R1_005126 [Sporobolomyces carnicolor]
MSTAKTTNNASVWADKLPKPLEEMPTFLCVIPDLADSKRMSVRPQHLEDAAVGHANGWIVKAGATFSDDSRSKMTGSWFLLREESSDKARERLSKDIYVTGGAWDMEKVVYKPDSMSTEEYIVILQDADLANKWIAGDRTIPLVDIVDSFDVFTTGQGAQGILERPSKQVLDTVFGSTNQNDIVETVLEKGRILSGTTPHKFQSKNDQRSGNYQSSAGSGAHGGR